MGSSCWNPLGTHLEPSWNPAGPGSRWVPAWFRGFPLIDLYLFVIQDVDAAPQEPKRVKEEDDEEAPGGASASGTQTGKQGEDEAQDASVSGMQGPRTVVLKDIARGFLRSERGHVIIQSGWSTLGSWAWLIAHRDAILTLPHSTSWDHHGSAYLI